MAKLLQNLVDLRDVFPGDRHSQSLFLQNQIVAPFDAVAARAANKQDELRSTNGLDILLRIVRHLISFQNDKWLNPSPGEAPNPLLELAWADLETENGQHTHKARLDVLKTFFPDKDLTKEDLSFEDLARHDLMHRSIWRRLSFLLYDPDTLSRKTGGDEWENDKPSEGEQGDKEMKELAEDSLVFNDPTKFRSLHEAIEDRFDIFVDPSRGRDYYFQFNEPTFIRVRYVPHHANAGDREEDVINTDSRRLIQGPKPNVVRIPESGSNVVTYNKVEVVHLHSQTSRDFLKMFHLDGSVLPVVQEKEEPDQCRSYMFYYLKAPLTHLHQGQNNERSNPPIRSDALPVLSSLAIELVEALDDPERSYEHVWDVIKQMAREMQNNQTMVPADDTVAQVLHKDNDQVEYSSMFLLLHTIHPRVLRSVCMGTVAYEFYDESSGAWSGVHSEHGPGAYAVGIAIKGRDGKFLTATEIRALINILQTYGAGCAAWEATNQDVFGQRQLDEQQTADLAWVTEIDNQYPPAGRVSPTSEMQADIEAESDAAADDGTDTEEEGSQTMRRPRFSNSSQSLATGTHALISMFQRRLMHGTNPSEPQIQSPLLIGSSNDLQARKQNCRPNVARLHSAANLYGLLMSCIKFMGLEPEEVFVPFTKAWMVSQINQGEVLGTVVASSLVSMTGLNVHDAGAKNETKTPPTEAVFQETRNEVNRQDWFLNNLQNTTDRSEYGQLKKLNDEIFSVTEEDMKAAEDRARVARNSYSAAIMEAENVLKEQWAELEEAKKALAARQAWEKEISELEDGLFDNLDWLDD
ncbi:hypothetical protein PG996_013709 [Apiospora saccharicola]|uniref:Uncharacterized protein n=1 Tax=Apiospora saccharicola TaxID=335842 RepID=A0ABR1U8X3_9PEZI